MMIRFKKGTPFGEKWYVRGQIAGFTRQAARRLVDSKRAEYYDGKNGKPKKKIKTDLFKSKK